MREDNYKKEIYKSWAHNKPGTFPYPSEKEVAEQTKSYSEIITKFLPKEKDKSILDLGCGYGFFLNACVKNGYKNISGVEITGEFIKVAEKTFNIKSISQTDIISHLKTEKTYDVITAFDVLEHFKKEELLLVLSLIYKSLRADGVFIFRAPNAESISGLYINYSDLTHEIPFTRLLVDEVLETAGFKNIRSLPSFVTSNKPVRLFQIFIAKIFGLDDKFMFSSNIIGVAKKL